ncbi:MAG: ABC transporter substrate-binding protein [Oscillospiraceae bacterium]|nr:ABC transporter substrate-binding protein [Oscillospiraceae bacterium]
MKTFRFAKFITVMLAAALLLGALAGCAGDTLPVDPDAVSPDGQQDDNKPVSPASDGKFTLRYAPDRSFNPYSSDAQENLLLSSLMYEGLFRLDKSFTAVPVLCDTCTTEDGLTYKIKILRGIKLTDGSALTAADVEYSLGFAAESERYKNRLSVISSCAATGPLTLEITLDSPNRSLPELLDVPIVKADTGENDIPVGTGPFILSRPDAPLMGAYRGYRSYENLPLTEIYLKELSDSELPESFADYSLDLVWDDTCDGSHMMMRGNCEVRGYSTTILQYIGFNAYSTLISDPAFRRAMNLAIDRAAVVRDAFDGGGSEAVLVLPKAHYLYNASWEAGFGFSPDECSEALKALGLEEKTGDRFLDIVTTNVNGKFKRVSFRFIVNSENPAKAEAAQIITDQLRAAGLDVRLETLPWETFVKRLESGEFDMYYAEVGLPPDFDLSGLLSYDGALNFGQMGSGQYDDLIEAFLNANGDEEKIMAAKRLCRGIAYDCPIIPILYREHEICTHRGSAVGAEPSVSGLFGGFTEWNIDLS